MSSIRDLALWMYGDVSTGNGFWYSHEIGEIAGLTEEQLFWVPDPNGLCILWHVGHIAQRERLHIGRFLQGIKGTIIPAEYEIFSEWCSAKKLRNSIDSIDNVFSWAKEVRDNSRIYIASLEEQDFSTVPSTSRSGLSVGHWIFITSAHTALHIGRIQLIRALIEDRHEEPCW